MCNILMVEDDKNILFANKIILKRRGYNVQLAQTLAQAREQMKEVEPDVIVLDIMLPDGNGLDFLAEIRRENEIPILLLTTLGATEDVVNGLAAGGDDYLAKPYDNAVLVGRIEALLRRAKKVPGQLAVGNISLDTASKKVFVSGEDLDVNIKEFSLLEQFVQYPERVMSAESLYEKVWGQDMLGDENAIRVRLSSLRKKLEESGADHTVTAIRGKGYFLEKS